MAKTTQKHGPHWFPFTWSKQDNPILGPNPGNFVSRNIYEPSVLFDGTTHLMMFRGESKQEPPMACVGRLGLAMSMNGTEFKCNSEPALVPDSPYEARGLAHPRLTMAGGVFMLTYAAYDGSRYRLCLATSSDLSYWFRHGPIFHDFDGDTMAGAILPIPTPEGKYLMYVGAGDLYLASSSNLIDWEISKKPVLNRKDCGSFASKSIAPGPSPFICKHGIVLILNGTDERDRTSAFAALFQADQPEKSLANLKEPFLKPEHDWEKFGYLPNVVRATGLSLMDKTLHLYYSGADRYVGTATATVPKDYILSKADEAAKPKKKTKRKKKVCGV